MVDHALHEKERRPRVDRVELVPKFDRGVGDRAAIGQRGGVDQRVNPSEPFERGGDDLRRRVRLVELGGMEMRRRAERRNLGCGFGAAPRVAPRQEEAGGSGARSSRGDGAANALGRAGDEDDAPVQSRFHP